jgi:acyl dehydratase
MTQDRIDKFADATGDHQWIHVDPNRAAEESPYGGTIAHGFLTLSLIPLLTDDMSPEQIPVEGIKQFVNYGSNKVRYMSPVRPGDMIRSNYHIVSVEKMRRTALRVVKKVTIEIEDLQKPACVVETVTLIFF